MIGKAFEPLERPELHNPSSLTERPEENLYSTSQFVNHPINLVSVTEAGEFTNSHRDKSKRNHHLP